MVYDACTVTKYKFYVLCIYIYSSLRSQFEVAQRCADYFWRIGNPLIGRSRNAARAVLESGGARSGEVPVDARIFGLLEARLDAVMARVAQRRMVQPEWCGQVFPETQLAVPLAEH